MKNPCNRSVIGFYPGTFDPIHLGHIHVINSILQTNQFRTIFVSVTGQNPLKAEQKPVASFQDRYTMVKLALSHFNEVQVMDYENSEDEPSYTIDTLRYLQDSNPTSTIRLIIASDLLETFSKWKDVETIISAFSPIVVNRIGYPLQKNNLEMLNIKGFLMSSTVVRKRLKGKKNCEDCLPRIVIDYIHDHELYL